jgi:hypothetical protein
MVFPSMEKREVPSGIRPYEEWVGVGLVIMKVEHHIMLTLTLSASDLGTEIGLRGLAEYTRRFSAVTTRVAYQTEG